MNFNDLTTDWSEVLNSFENVFHCSMFNVLFPFYLLFILRLLNHLFLCIFVIVDFDQLKLYTSPYSHILYLPQLEEKDFSWIYLAESRKYNVMVCIFSVWKGCSEITVLKVWLLCSLNNKINIWDIVCSSTLWMKCFSKYTY
jgi:hypothetical protein